MGCRKPIFDTIEVTAAGWTNVKPNDDGQWTDARGLVTPLDLMAGAGATA